MIKFLTTVLIVKLCLDANQEIQELGNYMPKYKYDSFWETRGIEPAEPFSESKQRLIRNILKEIEYYTVLEFGCGNGELSQLIKEKESHLTGVDISEDRLQMNTDIDARLLLNIANTDSLFPISDLVICSHFLLHIKPEDIDFVFQKMIDYTAKYIIFIEPDSEKLKGEWEYYNFKHDYMKLVKKSKLNYRIIPISDLVNCWVLSK